MPKPPQKRLSYRDVSKIRHASYSLSGSSALCKEFLPHDEAYNPDGTDKANPFANIKAAIEETGISSSREGTGNFLMLCMMGRQPEFDTADLFQTGHLTQEKKNISSQILQAYAPLPANASEEQVREKEQQKRQIDELFLRGLRRACHRLESLVMKAVDQGDLSAFLDPEVSMISSLCTIGLTNVYQEYKSKIVNGQPMPDSFAYRLRSKGVNNLSLEEQVLGQDGSFDDLQSKYADAASAVKEFIDITDFVSKNVGDRSQSVAPIIVRSLKSYISFELLKQRRRANPDADFSQLFPDKNPNDLIQQNKNNTSLADLKLDELNLFDYSGGISTVVADWIPDSPKVDPETHRGEKDYDYVRLNHRTEADSLAIYGANMMALNGELFRNIRWKIQPVIQFGGLSMKVDEFKFKEITRRDLLRAAFLSPMETDPYTESQRRDDIKTLTNLVNEICASDEVLGMLNAQELIKNIRTSLNQAKSTLEKPVNTTEEYQTLQKHLNGLKAAFQSAGQDVGRPFSTILKRVDFNTDILEAGGRMQPRPATERVESKSAVQERLQWMHTMAENLENIEGSRTSSEWKLMKESLDRAKAAATQIDSDIVPSRDALKTLDASMRVLTQAADSYVRHKVSTKGFENGKDFERLKLAKIISRNALREYKQTSLALQNQQASVQNEKGGATGRNYIEATMLELKKNTVALQRSAAKDFFGTSQEFQKMMKKVNKLTELQNDALHREGGVNQEYDQHLYGGTDPDGTTIQGRVNAAAKAVDDYLNHKFKNGDHKPEDMLRIDQAMQIRALLKNMQKAADNDAPRRAAIYEEQNRKREADNQKRDNIQAFKEKANRYSSDLANWVHNHMERQKDASGHSTPKWVLKDPRNLSQEEKNDALEKAYFLYCHAMFSSVEEQLNNHKQLSNKSEAVYRLVAEGRGDSLVQSVRANDTEIKYILDPRRLFEEGHVSVFSWLTSNADQKRVFQEAENRRAKNAQKDLQDKKLLKEDQPEAGEQNVQKNQPQGPVH